MVPSILPNITSAELNYIAFGLYSIDYHIQLYNYIPIKHGMRSNSVNAIDSKIISQPAYDASIHFFSTSHGTATYNTISTFIRNEIHHRTPMTFTEDELKLSTELLIKVCY